MDAEENPDCVLQGRTQDAVSDPSLSFCCESVLLHRIGWSNLKIGHTDSYLMKWFPSASYDTFPVSNDLIHECREAEADD